MFEKSEWLPWSKFCCIGAPEIVVGFDCLWTSTIHSFWIFSFAITLNPTLITFDLPVSSRVQQGVGAAKGEKKRKMPEKIKKHRAEPHITITPFCEGFPTTIWFQYITNHGVNTKSRILRFMMFLSHLSRLNCGSWNQSKIPNTADEDTCFQI